MLVHFSADLDRRVLIGEHLGYKFPNGRRALPDDARSLEDLNFKLLSADEARKVAAELKKRKVDITHHLVD